MTPLTHFAVRLGIDAKGLLGKGNWWAMNDLTRGERLQIMLTMEELEALDNCGFSGACPAGRRQSANCSSAA